MCPGLTISVAVRLCVCVIVSVTCACNANDTFRYILMCVLMTLTFTGMRSHYAIHPSLRISLVFSACGCFLYFIVLVSLCAGSHLPCVLSCSLSVSVCVFAVSGYVDSFVCHYRLAFSRLLCVFICSLLLMVAEEEEVVVVCVCCLLSFLCRFVSLLWFT